MNFRTSYAHTLPARALDLAAHVTAAIVLPGAWWLQFLPDMVLPLLWTRSMVTGRFAPESSWLLNMHRRLHLRVRRRWLMMATYLLWAIGLRQPWLGVHVLMHVGIDYFTHGKDGL